MPDVSQIISLLVNGGFAGFVAAIVTYVMKRRVDTAFQKDVEKLIKNLDSKVQKNQAAHERKLEIVEEAYRRLSVHHRDVKNLTKPLKLENEPDDEEKYKQAAKSGWEFYEYVDNHAIYFDEELIEKLEEYYDETKSSLISYKNLVIAREKKHENPVTDHDRKQLQKAFEKRDELKKKVHDNLIPELKEDLHEMMRDIVEEENIETN